MIWTGIPIWINTIQILAGKCNFSFQVAKLAALFRFWSNFNYEKQKVQVTKLRTVLSLYCYGFWANVRVKNIAKATLAKNQRIELFPALYFLRECLLPLHMGRKLNVRKSLSKDVQERPLDVLCTSSFTSFKPTGIVSIDVLPVFSF